MATEGAGRVPVRLGLDVLGGPRPASFADVARWTAAAEAGGFDSVWVPDEPRPDEPFEATTLLGALAVRTSSIRLGTLVPLHAGRPPAVAAKVLSAVDVVSDGRLVAGVGAGPGDPGGVAVAERLAEAVAVVRALFEGDAVALRGHTWHLDGAVNRPPPLRRSATPLVVEVDGAPLAGVVGLVDVVVVRGSPDEVAGVAKMTEAVGAGRPGPIRPAVVWHGRAVSGRRARRPSGPGALGTWLDLDRPDVCAATLRALGASGASGVIVSLDAGSTGGTPGASPGAGPVGPGGHADAVGAAGRLLAPLVAEVLGRDG